MMEQITQAVNAIFTDYEDTPELREFKEEIAANLSERVRDLMGGGLSRREALDRALVELGDVTEAADAVSRQKRKEVIGSAYAKPVPLDKKHAAGYPIMGLVLAFGLVVCAIAIFRTGVLSQAIGALMPFAVVAVGGFVYLGLTQETRAHLPMSSRRGRLYALAAMLLVFGGMLSGMLLFADLPVSALGEGLLGLKLRLIARDPVLMLGSLIPFVLPALALLAFLILTEKSRKKPWLLQLEEAQSMIYDEKFGFLSGALWIFAISVFVLLGFLIGWHPAWVVFLFAVAVQCLLLYYTAKRLEK